MFDYFYHQILRKTIISFGTLFNNITIQKKDDSDNTFSVMKVPIAYGPTQKFLARLEQQSNLNRPIEIQLPRMSFEFNGINYDAQRKLTKGNINISGFNNDAGYITSAGNTNIYNINGTLSGARELNQNGNNLRFRGTSNEEFQVYKSNATAVQVPRVRFETDDTHTSVLELQSSAPTTFLIDAYDAGNAPIFNVDGNGNLFAVSKSFLIEHPSKEGFNLRHGSLEGPEHGVYVRVKLDGNNTIELPDYWLDLVDEDTITVQLTPIGSHQNLYVKDIIDNTVIVANSALLSSKIKCFYFVQAERKDIDKMVVEYPRETPTI